MDRSQRAKAAAKAAQQILENPKAKDALKLQAAKLIFEYESEQARLAEQRAQRRHEQRKERSEIAVLKTLNTSLKKRLAALEEAVAGEKLDPDPTEAYFAQFREKTASTPAASAQQVVSADPALSAPVPAPAVRLDPRLEFKSETLKAAVEPQRPHPSLQSVLDGLDGKRPFAPTPAPRNAQDIAERERQITVARETAQRVQPIPVDPLDTYISELPPIADFGDGGEMPSDAEYLEALKEGNRALDRVLAQPRLRPLVENPIPDDAV